MQSFRNLRTSEQLAQHLGELIRAGRMHGQMPGVLRLEKELGVNRKTIEAALKILEKEGLLVAQGAGKRRQITVPTDASALHGSLRIATLLFQKSDRGEGYMLSIQHAIQEAGHDPFYAPKTLTGMEMQVERVEQLVRSCEADAWLVVAASLDVLQWFVTNQIPVLAIFGRRRLLTIASIGPDKVPAMREATRALLEFGHRRIVLMMRKVNRTPEPTVIAKEFCEQLAAHGVTPGPYHMPDWTETPKGYHTRLESLFKVTPPTAIIVDEVPFLIATLQFLASKRLRVPEDVSVVCTDTGRHFDWYQPTISHITWDSEPMIHRINQWLSRLARGKTDTRMVSTPAEFVRGGTIGPVNPEVLRRTY